MTTDTEVQENEITGTEAQEPEEQLETESPEVYQEDQPAANDLKIVLSINSTGSTIGIQKPGADPVFQASQATDPLVLVEEVPAVLLTAQAQWEESPTYPKHQPPQRQRQRARNTNQPPQETEDSQQNPRLF